MSGAIIFAVKRGSDKYGAPVDIAVAYGQDPFVSEDNQPISMDLGTVVLPLPLIKVAKLVDKSVVVPGEEMTYTIRVVNIGQRKLESDLLTVKDVLDSDVSYVANSASYASTTGVISAPIPDSSTGTAFPLDGEGFSIPLEIFRRGGAVDITFKVKLLSSTKKSKIVNKGTLSQTNLPDLPFDASSVVEYGASVRIDNTVYLGPGGEVKCHNEAAEYVEDYIGSNVTYCFAVTNTGKSHLGDIRISSVALGYSNVPNATLILAPGQTRIWVSNQRISQALNNEAVVLANPVFSSGLAIPDLDDVTSADPSAVGTIQYKANINITNTVHSGWDNGAACGTNRTFKSIMDFLSTPVTYCFIVTNNGDTHLNTLVVDNRALNFSRPISGILAPKNSTRFSVQSTLRMDLENVAVATAIPVLSRGEVIPGLEPVVSADKSGVALSTVLPVVSIQNKVYLGTDGGKKCNTKDAVEFVADFINKNVTYCFRVINSAGMPLTNLTVTVPELRLTRSNTTAVLRQSEVWAFHLDSKVTGPLKNTATVTASGALLSTRKVIEGLPHVTASDPSEVGSLLSGAGVDIQNTVYLGHNAGRFCQFAGASVEYVEGFAGTNVTYCFAVRNIGSTHLDNIVVTNALLAAGYSSNVRIAPGVAAAPFYLETTIGNALTNNAIVTARPVLNTGAAIGGSNVTDTDPSQVGLVVPNPQISISNTVYLGFKDSKFCDIAVEKVVGLFGSQTTYCFKVTNTGNTRLSRFVLDDPVLGYSSVVRSDLFMDPGQWLMTMFAVDIEKPLVNVCNVTAQSSVDGKTFTSVSASDPSEVGIIAHNPNVAISNTVYIGEPGSCEKGVETVRDLFLANIVYCFNITNTGDSTLSDVTITDKELNFTETLPHMLIPGESALISASKTILGDLSNTAVVTANPVLQDGTDIVGANNVTSSDPSAVEKLKFDASIDITNTVYLGNDGTSKCGTAVESVKDLFGSKVTYCFKVTNTGETHLRSISLMDPDIQYALILNQTLAPNESVLLAFPSAIFARQQNIVNVTAVPMTSTGKDILDIGEVHASDPSGVDMVSYSPSISIINTVYLGVDGGVSCDRSSDSVSDRYGAAVTFCLKVTNTGDTYLENVGLVDELIDYRNSSIGFIAPGASVTITVPGKITGDVTNEAVASGSPCLEDGTDILSQGQVKASDPSSVLAIAHKPSINIENTVYAGKNDGGALCSSSNETVKDFPMTAVMYCFEVMNSGDSYLKDIVITNAELTFEDSSINELAPGDKRVIAIPGTITKDLLNTAVVTAKPSLKDGTLIPQGGVVRDADPSSVELLPYSPRITIDNSVYLGSDEGKQCGTQVARDLVQGLYGAEVTYCLNVTNVGDTTLNDIEIIDQELNFTKKLSNSLAPGESITLPVDKNITKDLSNNAVVTANPVTSDLKDIPGLDHVRSEDPSAVDKFDFFGSIKIENTVYLGSGDNGAKCGSDAAMESVTGTYGTNVTYCFTIINTGDTHLANIVLSNTPLSFGRDSFKLLAPGENTTVSLASMIEHDLENLAVVNANPVTSEGKEIQDVEDVGCEDPSGVKKIDSLANVTITNTVYRDHDGGKKCGTMESGELVMDYFGAKVTYCFEVTNTGESFLNTVVVTNGELDVNDESIGLLEPGSTVVLSIDGVITGTVGNVATVTALPSLKDGKLIPGMNNVTASDPSGVQTMPFLPNIVIENTVFLGGEGLSGEEQGSLCHTSVEFVEHYVGAFVTYCFKVTNKGDTVLNEIIISDPELDFTDDSIGQLGIGETVTVAFTSTITKKLTNNATVIATPITDDGIQIPNISKVTSSDPSSVALLLYSPSVGVANTVYLGDDNGMTCAVNGVELAVGMKDTNVVYCFKVTNTGDTYLNNLILANGELNFTDSSIAVLAPGESKLVVFPSSIAANLTNNVVATANPSLKNGADIPGAQDVTATDPSRVEMKVNGTVKEEPKPPYVPPGPPDTCINDKWKAGGKEQTLVCATKEVFLTSLVAKKPLSCKPGEQITLSIDGTIRMEGSRSDLGWYVAVDGGDAMNGKCVLNGLQKGSTYDMVDPNDNTTSVGKVAWTADQGGDDDECGDVVLKGSSADVMRFPFVVNSTLTCADENDDGILDIAVCFTWSNKENNDMCTISTNAPTAATGSCYCTRYDVLNVPVKPTDPVVPC